MKLLEFFSVSKLDDEHSNRQDNEPKIDKERMFDDLYWFILDHDSLHKTYFLPIARKIDAKRKSKGFDKSTYIKKFLPMINKGCMLFYKEKSLEGDPKDIFSKSLRKDLCHRILNQSYDDICRGEYKIEL